MEKSDKEKKIKVVKEPFVATLAATFLTIAGIVYIVGAILAGWYSWSCNANHGYDFLSKVIFATIAGSFSWSYMLAYLIYKSGTCGG